MKVRTPFEICEAVKQLREEIHKWGIEGEITEGPLFDFEEVQWYSESKLVALMRWMASNNNVVGALQRFYARNNEILCDVGKVELRKVYKQLKLFNESPPEIER